MEMVVVREGCYGMHDVNECPGNYSEQRVCAVSRVRPTLNFIPLK